MNDESWTKVKGKGAGQYKDENNTSKSCRVKLNEDGTLNRLDVLVDKNKNGIHDHFYLNVEKDERGYIKRN